MPSNRDVFVRFYPESSWGGFSDVDGTIAFYSRVNALLRPDSQVLDLGCGRGALSDDPVEYRKRLRQLGGKCARVVGADVDPAAAENPFIDEFRLLDDSGRLPFGGCEFDVCVSDNVLEHVKDPPLFFSEVFRVLRGGGIFCARTTNRRSYVGLASRLLPRRFHGTVLAAAQPERRAEDVFRTWHRCNTRGTLRRLLRGAGLDGIAYGYEAEPSYLAFSPLLYRLGTWHQRWAPRCFKPTLFVFARRTAALADR